MADVKDGDLRKVGASEAGMRLDRWLKTHYPALPHGLMQKLLRNGQIRVDGGRAKPDARLESGQQVKVRNIAEFDAAAVAKGQGAGRPSLQAPLGISKADRDFIERAILYEDDELMVLNKPYGIAVQGGTKTTRHIDGMLANMADRFG